MKKVHAELQGKWCAYKGADPFTRESPCQEVPEGKSAILMILLRPIRNTRNWTVLGCSHSNRLIIGKGVDFD